MFVLTWIACNGFCCIMPRALCLAATLSHHSIFASLHLRFSLAPITSLSSPFPGAASLSFLPHTTTLGEMRQASPHLRPLRAARDRVLRAAPRPREAPQLRPHRGRARRRQGETSGPRGGRPQLELQLHQQLRRGLAAVLLWGANASERGGRRHTWR